MNPTDNNPGDEQLDDLLRQIEVPDSLKDDLRQIPQMHELHSAKKFEPTTNHQYFWPGVFALVAVLFGLVAFLTWQFQLSQDSNDLANKTQPSEKKQPLSQDTRVAELQQQIDELQSEADWRVAHAEIQQLESRLTRFQAVDQEDMAQEQYTSIILAMADQTVIDLGGSSQSVETSMVSVIDQFPDTSGAEIAQRYLDRLNN